MLKISVLEPSEGAAMLRLEGRLIGPWVVELQRTCEETLGTGRAVCLQLGDVEFVDPQGVALLAEFQARGVPLLGCPPFAAELLKATATKGEKLEG
jgi:ABC-type transporter Mla MlaB component